MKTWHLLTLLGLALLGGLTALLLIWRPWSPTGPAFATAQESGYVIEYEYDPKTPHIHESNTDDGKERVRVVVQGGYTLSIIDGEVMVNRQSHGTVKKGDRLKITRDLKLWVNGDVRKP